MTRSGDPASQETRPAQASARGRLRFVWTSDATGTIRFLTEDPRLDALRSAIDGRTWPQNDGVAAALRQQKTFVGLAARLETQKGTLDVSVSGTPITNKSGVFDGFRGFGTADALPETVSPPQADPPSKPSAEPASAARRTPETDAAPGLSEVERQAFRDIARALGERPSRTARPASETATDTASERAPEITSRGAEPIAAPFAAVSDSNTTPDTQTVAAADETASVLPEPAIEALLDRLPIGVLLSRGAVPILMNQTLLDWLDYDSVDAFYEAGGIETMFGGRHPGRRSPLDEDAMLVRRRDGDTIGLSVELQTIAWGDLPASLMLFERARAQEPETDHAPVAETAPVSHSEMAAILETATDGVMVLDGEGRILMLNRSAEALFGYDSADVEGERFVALLNEESRARILDYLEGLKGTGVQSLLNDGREITALTRQGGTLPLFVTIGRLGDTPNAKFCVVLRDISPFKRNERDLVDARRAAETASARKSDFLARISHEIRTPLSAIIGFAEIMQEERFGPLGSSRYKDYLNDILTSGAHVVDLVNDLLDLSKIEAGRADLEFREVDVNAVLVNASSILQEEARRARVVMRMSLDSRLPAVVADERALNQIILNLISNAIKFTPEGGQVIVSSARTAEGELVIRVKDTGLGMTEQELATALEPFRQLPTSRKTGGTGLGLPLTKALVEANRAAFTIKSARNNGTLVEITFPPTRVLAN